MRIRKKKNEEGSEAGEERECEGECEKEGVKEERCEQGQHCHEPHVTESRNNTVKAMPHVTEQAGTTLSRCHVTVRAGINTPYLTCNSASRDNTVMMPHVTVRAGTTLS
ncbi:hypothetical protein RRG08_000675 [Elysia crispata]|uniref:Uncharacterized protein n=1 Tax=Elysia crispata TaxID=231223 RepID=A0AAE1AKS8_9GAST|nr:hypothetical protein RRG08_000675 [Elysia crispata]